jgi:hypothetical protein
LPQCGHLARHTHHLERRARIIELRHEHLMMSSLGSLFGLLVQSLTLACRA